MNYLDIKFPKHSEYSSDKDPIPLEFYLDVLPCSKVIYLKLGYFSSKAIQVLAYGFAQFVFNGGVIKIVTNHFLYKDDMELLQNVNLSEEDPINDRFLQDLKWINEGLQGTNQHFMDCLKYLVKHEKLEIIPVILKPSRMVHYKQGLFFDDSKNSIFMDGSCNFTANGLLENAESISIYRSWGSEFERNKVEGKHDEIEEIIAKKSKAYHYLAKENILNAVESIGKDKNIKELLDCELGLLQSNGYKENIKRILLKYEEKLVEKLKVIEMMPKFPFDSFPRDYQIEAYKSWKENSKQGIFAMATGTGKTITALNCLLNEYKENENYQAIILVPSKSLLNQWNEEVSSFNFQNILLVSSDHKWRPMLSELNTSLLYQKNKSFIVIVTYQTFSKDDFQKKIKNLPKDTLLIADEAHNMGRPDIKKLLPSIHYMKRLALSATPKRNYDSEANEVLEKFFNSKEPYTFSFSMEKAIREGILCEYEYYPHIVYLNDEEMLEYIEITRKLVKLYGSEEKGSKDSSYLELLLLERKRIIHKADNKIATFEKIIKDHMTKYSDLRYSFVYAPEGNDKDNINMLEKYMNVLKVNYPSVRAYPYTSISENNKEVMENFEQGFVDVLFSMKCLDEGVDIPRAELAIFCSSTGNPRQFIQRRGRVLRKHPEKDFAIVHDLVVIPIRKETEQGTSSIEKNMIKNELTRVIYFASLSRNYYEAMNICQPVAEEYALDIFALQDELKGEL